ncbi:MAG: MATE family efflux transporter [Clostridia bacterium]
MPIRFNAKKAAVSNASTLSAENSITEGVIWKQLLVFFFPILLGTFFQQLYNTADAIIVGKFVGTAALAAVGGATGNLINLLVGFFVGLSSGATVIISQFFGGRKDQELSHAVHTATALAISGGLVFTVVGIVFSPAFLSMMGTPPEVMEYAVVYIRIYFVGMVPSLIYNVGSGILRAIGDSRRPLYFLICACMVNILLDIICVVGLEMGVAGAALATIISQMLSAVLVVITLCRSPKAYRLEIKKIRFHMELLQKIIRIGFPAGLQSVMYSLSNVIIQASVNSFGTSVLAAWTAYGKLDGLFWMTISAFGISITTFVGQNVGAGKLSRAHRGVRQALSMSLLITAVLAVMFMLCARQMMNLFTPDAEVIDFGVRFALLISPFYLASCFNQIYAGALRGAGNAKIPMFIMLFSFVLFRQGYLYAAKLAGNSFVAIALGYPLGWVVCSLLLMVFYQKSALNRAGKEAERSEKTA